MLLQSGLFCDIIHANKKEKYGKSTTTTITINCRLYHMGVHHFYESCKKNQKMI